MQTLTCKMLRIWTPGKRVQWAEYNITVEEHITGHFGDCLVIKQTQHESLIHQYNYGSTICGKRKRRKYKVENNKKDGYRQRNVRQFCNQPKAHYLATSGDESRRYVVAFTRFAGEGIWLRQESLRHILTSPWVRHWENRGKCYIDDDGWKENSMLVKCIAACTHLSSTVSQ